MKLYEIRAMTVLPIIQPDNPLLRRPAARVTDFGQQLQTLIDDMRDTMLEAEGVGLAGPQVARSLRVIVARAPEGEDSRENVVEAAGKFYVLANPRIIWRSDEMVSGVLKAASRFQDCSAMSSGTAASKLLDRIAMDARFGCRHRVSWRACCSTKSIILTAFCIVTLLRASGARPRKMKPSSPAPPEPMSAVIRLASSADAADIHQIYRPIVRDTHISFEQSVPTVDEIADRIKKTLKQYPWLVCEIDGRLAGYAYASAFRVRAAYQWTAEATVYIHADFQRRGVSRGLYRSLLAILREQGYCSAVGVIALPNEGSIRAHESVGFRKVGVIRNVGHKADAWRDTGWWQLELRQPPEKPRAPLAIPQLATDDKFDDLLQPACDTSALKWGLQI